MKYDLKHKPDADRALEYLTELSGREALVEVKRVSRVRSLNQNSYLHLLLGAFGQHFGYTIDEAKTLYKRKINPDIYVYDKNGERFLKSSATLTIDEMTKSIDRFRQFSAEHDYPLPDASNTEAITQLENAIEQQERYL